MRAAVAGAWIQLEREAVDHAFAELRIVVLCGYVFATHRVLLQLHRRMGFGEVSVA
jgi:hypothetical protein